MNESCFFNIILIVMFALAGLIFISLLFMTAPYGRYVRQGFGPKISARLGWIIQESPSVVSFAVFYWMGEGAFKVVPLILFALWQIHYLHRTYIYPFRMRWSGKNITMTTFLSAFIFTTINGYINGRYITHFSSQYSVEWLTTPNLIIGMILFFLGLAINFQSDGILRKLRKPGETDYKIPSGGFFKFVSSPNYMGEIIEWTGWAIATWSLPGLCFAVWTIANLAPRALSHHKWYLEKFPDYPKERKAIVPFII